MRSEMVNRRSRGGVGGVGRGGGGGGGEEPILNPLLLPASQALPLWEKESDDCEGNDFA